MHPHKPNPRRTDFGLGLRGAPRDRRHLGTPSGVPRVQPRGLLRLIEEQARPQTLSRIATMVTMPPIGALLVLVGIVLLFSATACSPRGYRYVARRGTAAAMGW
jgi:hypothetical protein